VEAGLKKEFFVNLKLDQFDEKFLSKYRFYKGK